jgi:DNA invertase Pin-like site-specific DNA recombinase
MMIVTKLDRLARSTTDMLNIVTDLGRRGIKFRSVAEPWANTDSPAAELMLTVMAGIAPFERGRIRERQTEGIDKAREAGRYIGPKRKITPEMVAAKLAEGLGASAVAKALGCRRATFYRDASATNSSAR